MRKKAESVLKFLTKPRPPRRPGALARGLIFWVLVGVSPFASALNPPSDEAAQGWIRLFDGQSLFGWSSPSGTWKVNEGALVSEAVQQGWLRTTSSFSDFDLKFEAQVSGGPARLLFRADPQSKPAQPGYELSLTDGTIAGIDGGTASPASNGWKRGLLFLRRYPRWSHPLRTVRSPAVPACFADLRETTASRA